MGAGLANMQLITKFNTGICFLLCVINIFLLKGKKGITTTNAFQNILGESNRKPNKIWVDKGNEFYKRSMINSTTDHDVKYKTKENLLLLRDLLES